MIIQISSGQGPIECEFAVSRLYRKLKKEYSDIREISAHKSRFSDCYTSVMFETEENLQALEGTIQCIFTSPFRPNHKRKNWYVDVSIIPEQEIVCMDKNIRFERFHCGGNGGQNVNKVETGIRLIHIPTGISVTSTAERSQLLNKKDALEKLNKILENKQLEQQKLQINKAWREHNRIIRGNPVRIYKDIEFRRIS